MYMYSHVFQDVLMSIMHRSVLPSVMEDMKTFAMHLLLGYNA